MLGLNVSVSLGWFTVCTGYRPIPIPLVLAHNMLYMAAFYGDCYATSTECQHLAVINPSSSQIICADDRAFILLCFWSG